MSLDAADDMCDICMRSGVSVSRTTLDGRTVCDDDGCQEEADQIDFAEENDPEDSMLPEDFDEYASALDTESGEVYCPADIGGSSE